jgi:RNA polymerase sigma factor (sigma-70 family)
MVAVAEFEDFFAESYDGVVRGLTVALADRSRAEDAAQVGFEQAFRKWRTVGAMDRPDAWVYVVALRQQRRWLRDERRDRPTEGPGSSPDLAVAALAAMSVREMLGRLAPRQRAAVVLRHVGGLTLAEVAEAMGVKVGTVKATLHTAYGHLRVESATDLEDSDASG